jgi:hypothetical protein
MYEFAWYLYLGAFGFLIWILLLSVLVIVMEVKMKRHFESFSYDIQRLSTKVQAVRRRISGTHSNTDDVHSVRKDV